MKRRKNVVYHSKKILEYLHEKGDGVKVSEVAIGTGLHRATVSRLCIKLSKSGYIQRKNKQANYYLTGKAYGDPAVMAFSLGSEGWNRIREWILESNPIKFQNRLLTQNVSHLSSGDKREFERQYKKLQELIMSEFSQKVGALVVYHILCSLEPKRITFDSGIFQTEKKIPHDDIVAFRWLNNSIKPLSILHEFCRLPTFENMFLPYAGDDSSAYELKTGRHKNLIEIFQNLYPDIYTDLEKHRKNLSMKTDTNHRVKKRLRLPSGWI